MVINALRKEVKPFYNGTASIASLVILRIAFGGVMLVSTVRFLLKGWVGEFYIRPKFHFTFYGFDWVRPPGAIGTYLLFALLIVASLMMIAGLFYRLAAVFFFLCFTYVELMDKTTYLNHYYLVSIIAFLMILAPAGNYFSLDVWRKPSSKVTQVPSWCINIFRLQLLMVYFFAGLAKLNHDWLIDAMPLKIWLPANSHLPIIGGLLTHSWVAYAFSWSGAAFDLLIGFFLWNKRTIKPAYVIVVIFHLVTGWFFKIGMFPYIMIFVTLIYFPDTTHQKIINHLRGLLRIKAANQSETINKYLFANVIQQTVFTVLVIHFVLQMLLPFRYLLYPGDLYWTEEGYRFSWRVMLMEKDGTIFFHVKDPATGRQSEIINSQYLTQFQESQMATQPDMILQFAHFLAQEFQEKGIKAPIITAQSYVTLNGSGSRLYIDSTVDLAKERETFGHKKWILPFTKTQE